MPAGPDYWLTPQMDAWLAELERRVATVHERVACPKCGAVVGDRCHRVGTMYLPGYDGYAPPPSLKHPHAERLRAGGIPLR